MGLFENFPYTNFHEINLDQIIKIMRQMQDEWQQVENDWDSMQDFINNYFDNLDVSEEVLQALQTMAGDGELNTIIDPVIVAETAAWLAEHITPTSPAVDNTLSIAGAAADAKATGDAVADLKEDLSTPFNIEVSANLLDSSATSDGYIREGGNLTVAGDWHTTDFIPVEYGEIYTYSFKTISTGIRSKGTIYFRLEFDASRGIISGSYQTTALENYTPSTSNVKYVRFSIHWPDTETDHYFVKGYSIDYSEFGEKFYELKEDSNSEEVKNIITASDVFHSRNLFDKNKIVPGYISNSTGKITVASDWVTTDFIPVEYGKEYSCSNNDGKQAVYFALELDANKTPVSYNNIANEPYTPTANNVKYIRFSQHEPQIPTLTFVESAQYSCIYTPYGYDMLTAYHSLLYGKKWVAVGDSLTEKNATALSNYTDFITVKNNMDIINFGVSGTGYMRGYDTDNAFYQRVTDIPDCDIITIFGSGNDLTYFNVLGDVTDNTTDTICGCINETLDIIFANHPTTPLLVISPTPWKDNTPDLTTGMALYCEKLKAICSMRGIAYLDIFHHSGLRPNDTNQRDLVFYGDGNYNHPNKLGHSIIAPRIMQAMESVMMF